MEKVTHFLQFKPYLVEKLFLDSLMELTVK
jgi:hypothetical protein